MNVMTLLEMAAEGFGDHVAFTDGQASLTYRELYAAAGSAAARLRDSACEHLALLDVNNLALPVALFASGWAGKPFVPLNYRLSAAEVDALLARIEPAFLVTDAKRAQLLSARDAMHTVGSEAFLAQVRGEVTLPATDWPMDPEEVAVLLFTSGTTGAPKAAVLRHKHLVSYMFTVVEFGSALGQTALVCVPPYHIAGVVSAISSVYAGRKVVQMANFSARRWIELARQEQVTHAFLVPTMLGQIVQELEGETEVNLPQLAALSYGGGKMPRAVIERAMTLLPHVSFAQAYGMTETSSTLCVLVPEDHRAALASDLPHVRRRLTSVGRALPGVELQIRAGDGSVLGPGERGEIYVRGEQVSGEYVGRGSLLDAEGWFPTRDAGELDDEGFLFLEGRADDVIVRGAENMSPGEIEDVLLRHPAIADAGVVGVPDEHWGEAVAAVVVLRQGGEASEQVLQDWVREHLRSSRVPQHIRFSAQLPYNETGKLLRRRLREEWSGQV